jgi:hypothetical protein
MSDKVGHVSASSIAAFKACPKRYRIGYVEAIREAVEAQPLRFGTNWHKGLEVLGIHGELELAIEAATTGYATVPDTVDATEWAVEREILANALAAYHWLYGSSDEYAVVATELSFDLPLNNPETGHPTPNFRKVGKIDRILRNKATGALLIGENKTTSRPIDSGSTYWARLRKDTQSKFYIVAARDMQAAGRGMNEVADQVSGLLHDVFHKPQISPKKLTQAESAEFVQTGEYCGQKFEIAGWTLTCMADMIAKLVALRVDGVQAEVEPGKKEGTFALRETPGMFGARLFQDMTTDPAKYFARREIAFTDAELKDFEYQVWALQKMMNEMERTGYWYENENQCEATGSFKCSFCPICYNNVDVFNGQTPPGYKRLRVEQAEQTDTSVGE